MERVLVTLILCCLAFGSMSAVSAGQEKAVTVSAAISLKNAFEEIGKLYEAKQGAKVTFNFGASGDLMKQIVAGAPVDVFAAAAQKDMDEANKQSFIVSSTHTAFTANSVVLIVPAGSKTSLNSFEGLSTANIKRIAIVNPKTSPAGRYAEEVFHYYKVSQAIKDKLVFTENVRQALDYVARGEVDAGIVYVTDAAARTREAKIVATAPEASHKPVIYPVAVVKGTKNETLAKAFISLVLSPEGQKILQKYGFKPVK
ncbi:MAG: molybdate ABC transporter substrate-binding protein [Thermodesulfovibrio sp.]|nr:molybdate ABC transporter substrate-binding protein [Thermodesulfovibrio sp.]